MAITLQTRVEAKEYLVNNWNSAAYHVIELCEAEKPFNGTYSGFLENCMACGGNWGAMLLSGIKRLYPSVYDAIPDNMGKSGTTAFICLCCVLQLLGIDMSE